LSDDKEDVTAHSKRGLEKWPFLPFVTIGTVIATLYLGQDLLIPFVLALLISFLLTRPVTWLEKLKLGRVLSVLIVISIAFAIAGAVLWVIASQLSSIVSELPRYQQNIGRKIEAIRNPAGTSLARVATSLEQVTTELSSSSSAAEKQKTIAQPRLMSPKRAVHQPQSTTPVPVEVVPHRTSAFESFGVAGTSLARFLGGAGAVLILALFMLINRGDLRNRLVRLLGDGNLVAVTTALDDAAERVSRYLLTQSLVNATFGTLLGLGLYWIGVPYAPFWGILAALLRFIPYVGTLVAGACPLLLALAVFDGWRRPLYTLGLFITIEGITSSLVEPWLYSTRTGISSLAILVSAAFWTLLWGPIGLVLSTPLTVCLAVLGRHAPQLEFLNVLLGDEPVLSPEARFYQRLLAMDEDEASEIVDECLKEKSLVEVYDSVLIPALSLAERDRHQNRLDDEREEFIYQSMKDLIQELGERSEVSSVRSGPEFAPALPISIRCLPARDRADELVGLMLAQLLRRAGYHAEAISLGPAENMLDRLTEADPNVLCVSALPPLAVTHARSICRRARQKLPHLRVVVGLWNSGAELEKLKQRLGPDCSDSVMTTLAQAEAQVRVFEPAIPVQKA
jgi:predicted PurR-regulated permease PerM